MAELLVPKLNNNDTDYVLTDWLVADGDPVAAGDPVAVVETSKATEELEAGAAGTLRHRVAAGARCRPGERIADVRDGATAADADRREDVAQPAPPQPAAGRQPTAAPQPAGAPLITRPAQDLADELDVTAEELAALSLAVVRRADVEALRPAPAAQPPAARQAPAGVPLTRVQQGVARAVEISHRTIPAAYTVVRMDLGPARAHGAALTRAVRRPVGLAELFVQQVAALHPHFPRFFAAIDGTTAVLADAPHIGVTVDLGEGLYVPCVRNPAELTIAEIATRLMSYRVAASGGTFRESDLGGANFVITLHTEGDVVLAVPFVFPGTVCALAVTSPADGSPANIGLAYDHRLVNGRDASLFLHALKTSMEGLA